MVARMHYSPVLPAAGLLVAGQVVPSTTPALEAARLLLDLAGMFFLLLAALFIILNTTSALRHGAWAAQASLTARTRGRHVATPARAW